MTDSETIKKLVWDAGNAMRVQQDQIFGVEEQGVAAQDLLSSLSDQGDAQDAALRELLQRFEGMGCDFGDEVEAVSLIDPGLLPPSENELALPDIRLTKTVQLADEETWDSYMDHVIWYAYLEKLDLSSDPYMSLMSKREQEEFANRVREDYYERTANCDAVDYALSAFCGVVTGLIDALFVGMPGESKLGDWTDRQTENFVQEIAKKLWKKDQPQRQKIRSMKIPLAQKQQMLKEAGIPYGQQLTKPPETLQQCIQYLENKFKVNYDARYADDLIDGEKYLNRNKNNHKVQPDNHHMKSLAHAPDLVGLIFSLIDQFTGETSIIESGRVIRLVPVDKKQPLDTFELRGTTFISKLFCGVANWIGHIASDLVGSSGAKTRGSGVPIPGYELFQFLNIGDIRDGNNKSLSIAEISVRVFENGYDARFGAAMAIPVVMNDLLVRFCYAIKRYYYNGLPIKECVPMGAKQIQRQPELRRMLLVAHGTLCAIDATDAVVHGVTDGGADAVSMVVVSALHLNYFAYIKLAKLGFAEVRAIYRQNHINLKALQKDIDAEWGRLYGDTHVWETLGLSDTIDSTREHED